jgi:hypothetical protein
MESSERMVDASDTLTMNKIGDEHGIAHDFTAGGHSHDDDDEDDNGDGSRSDQIDKG